MEEDYKNIVLGKCRENSQASVVHTMQNVIYPINFRLKKAVIEVLKTNEGNGKVTILINPIAEYTKVLELTRIISTLADHYKVPFSREDRGIDDSPGQGGIPKTPVVPPQIPPSTPRALAARNIPSKRPEILHPHVGHLERLELETVGTGTDGHKR